MDNLKDISWHKLAVEKVVEFLGVNLTTGLPADEIHRRQKEFGPNRVTARRGTPMWRKKLSLGYRASDNAKAFTGGFRLWANADGARRRSNS